ncbi:MAG: ABC transporter permease [Crocinitomicaceae bacterium]|nr:ABC transporter permease [Crocinitomicaceae bacterium]
MKQILASIKKEIFILLSDKIGLALLFIMPVLLVLIITIVQDSAFKVVNENKFSLLIVNKDKGVYGDSLVNLLDKTGNFDITIKNNLVKDNFTKEIIANKHLLGVYIPSKFSSNLTQSAEFLSQTMLAAFGAIEAQKTVHSNTKQPVEISYDPVLQENIRFTFSSSVSTILKGLENKIVLESLFKEMDFKEIPLAIRKQFNNQCRIKESIAQENKTDILPNSTQHNVPAWTIFAMFFMVISLGGNIVKERNAGSFIRLQTIPNAFIASVYSKIMVYFVVALLQILLLFAMGRLLFPLIGLPVLTISSSFFALFLFSVLAAFSAISYAMCVGTYAKTHEQSNGFGAVSIIIFAAIGGIWVPTFVMPEYMQTIALISPLHWCLDGYYTLFLKNGSWYDLRYPIVYLLLFSSSCQLLMLIKLKKQHYI